MYTSFWRFEFGPNREVKSGRNVDNYMSTSPRYLDLARIERSKRDGMSILCVHITTASGLGHDRWREKRLREEEEEEEEKTKGIGLGFGGFASKFPARSVSLLVFEMFWCGGML